MSFKYIIILLVAELLIIVIGLLFAAGIDAYITITAPSLPLPTRIFLSTGAGLILINAMRQQTVVRFDPR